MYDEGNTTNQPLSDKYNNKQTSQHKFERRKNYFKRLWLENQRRYGHRAKHQKINELRTKEIVFSNAWNSIIPNVYDFIRVIF